MAYPATGGAERVIPIADQQDALCGHDGEDKLGQDSIFVDEDLKPIFHVVSRSDVDRTRPPKSIGPVSTSAAGGQVATKPPRKSCEVSPNDRLLPLALLCQGRYGDDDLFSLDVGRLDNRPPLRDLGLLKGGKRLRRHLIAREKFVT